MFWTWTLISPLILHSLENSRHWGFRLHGLACWSVCFQCRAAVQIPCVVSTITLDLWYFSYYPLMGFIVVGLYLSCFVFPKFLIPAFGIQQFRKYLPISSPSLFYLASILITQIKYGLVNYFPYYPLLLSSLSFPLLPSTPVPCSALPCPTLSYTFLLIFKMLLF